MACGLADARAVVQCNAARLLNISHLTGARLRVVNVSCKTLEHLKRLSTVKVIRMRVRTFEANSRQLC